VEDLHLVQPFCRAGGPKNSQRKVASTTVFFYRTLREIAMGREAKPDGCLLLTPRKRSLKVSRVPVPSRQQGGGKNSSPAVEIVDVETSSLRRRTEAILGGRGRAVGISGKAGNRKDLESQKNLPFSGTVVKQAGMERKTARKPRRIRNSSQRRVSLKKQTESY